ncbi:hypothetical protein TTHERM_000831549 (macronuclear) [Tetrahymena thermophila SB210]|uniref:Uncharacterized protein n=1 Tax=Tetrahymena thermophila (strain SB210) TaxID=312017 RepID=W7XKK6_TETTS|nr:hypothetical protein TTHERM_000831549 [Tetrahymena thermophila SB210]EWS74979.1 hypothetical protein TTHERM_000831549 [Tetrahymena thermophila SB210]|eukprot:XP_012652478.1 hypothetical protein TTHERM_000831549 [Tetrahymena thermophila SB210]
MLSQIYFLLQNLKSQIFEITLIYQIKIRRLKFYHRNYKRNKQINKDYIYQKVNFKSIILIKNIFKLDFEKKKKIVFLKTERKKKLEKNTKLKRIQSCKQMK